MHAIQPLNSALNATLVRALNFLLPEKCALCRCISNLGFCIKCQKLLPWTECACAVCGIHLHEPGVCGRCQIRRPVYQHSIIPFRYAPPVSTNIQALKYAEQLSYAVAMGKILSLSIAKDPTPWPDLIVPIPLHRKRMAQRGFNQASEIARVLSKQLGIPINYSLIKRVKNTVTQTGLNEKKRQQNMNKAFIGTRHAGKTSTGKNATPYQHVALLDDVVTSGSTVNAAAKALLDVGIRYVSVWAIAKT